MMLVKAGSTDVTTYFHLRLAATGLDATGLTITAIDLTYVRTREEPAAKVDATALADQDTAHTDNTAIEVDGTNMPGVYRVDWPDAAFASGAREVILAVKEATILTESLRVQIEPVAADVTHWTGTAVASPDTAGYPVVTIKDGTGTGEINTASGGVLVSSFAAGAITAAAIATDAIDADAIAAGAIDASALAADAVNEIVDAVWDEALAGHATAGTAGAALGAAGTASDPWAIVLPGAYGPSTAGALVGACLDVPVSTRASAVTAAAIQAQTDQLTFTLSNQVDANIVSVNETAVQGAGSSGNEWRPV